jgi:hypothetical protein
MSTTGLRAVIDTNVMVVKEKPVFKLMHQQFVNE